MSGCECDAYDCITVYALHIDKRTARTAEKVSSISTDYLVIFCVTSDAINGKEEKKADDCKSSANGVNTSFTFYAAILKSNS